MWKCSIVATAVLSLTLATSPVSAKEKIWKFNGEVIDNSLKCDLAMAARSGSYQISANLMNARIVVTVENARSVESKFSAKFPLFSFGAGGGVSSDKKVTQKHEATFRINKQNSVNCAKNNKFATGLLDCLKDALREISDKDRTDAKATCTSVFTATYSGSASAKLPVWTIELGPELTGKNTVSYNLNAVVPASKASEK
ncbi:exported hypothetical protein [Mesorhizobium plurifarium]|uniref:Uncharacterized protein n=1 Tax=Mesorhizobium plurifarium TaxID=69974 RepID=A0A0K2W3M5_MESPL|nr:exported hypothetical protein [Mesorhizobium plurifarium]